MEVKLKLKHSGVKVPVYSTDGAGAFDIFVDLPEDTVEYIYPGKPKIFSTGLFFEIPKGKTLLVFSRSGQGFKDDVRLSNCVGVIDSDYRGELGVKLTKDRNDYLTSTSTKIKHGDRIAQGIIIDTPVVQFKVVEELSETVRGSGGLGSTGK